MTSCYIAKVHSVLMLCATASFSFLQQVIPSPPQKNTRNDWQDVPELTSRYLSAAQPSDAKPTLKKKAEVKQPSMQSGYPGIVLVEGVD